MKIGLFGYPSVGKTTLFNALTGAHETVGAGRRESHLGTVRVPDVRLDRLAELFRPRKLTHASVEFVDVIGFQREDESAAFDVEPLKGTAALAHVVRAFDGPIPHSEGSIDPARDAATMETELILADHAVLDRRVTRLHKLVKRGAATEERAELTVLERCMEHLGDDQPLRTMELAPEERRRLGGFGLLSLRPLLVVVNVGEDRIDAMTDPADAFGLQKFAARPHVAICAASAQIEMEITALGPEDARSFLDDLGLNEPASFRVIQSAYGLLGLQSFFTVGEDECRAWTIPTNTPARKAAGVIHSDLERGFIRAEVVGFDDLLDCGSMARARELGKLRLEGKEYAVREGEVVHFRFNV